MATRERPDLSSAPTELIGPPAPPPAEPPPDRELRPWLLVLSVLVIAALAAVWYATRNSAGAAGPVTVHFECYDGLSGLAAGACPADVVLSADGAY